MEYEPYQRLAERITSELEQETSKPVSTPLRRGKRGSGNDDGGRKYGHGRKKKARRFRAMAAMWNCLLPDRPIFGCRQKCICKNMTLPRGEDWVAF